MRHALRRNFVLMWEAGRVMWANRMAFGIA
jgi:hypothetical protein